MRAQGGGKKPAHIVQPAVFLATWPRGASRTALATALSRGGEGGAAPAHAARLQDLERTLATPPARTPPPHDEGWGMGPLEPLTLNPIIFRCFYICDLSFGGGGDGALNQFAFCHEFPVPPPTGCP